MIAAYKNHRPSGLNLFAACPSMFVLEYVLGLKQEVGVSAYRGVAVEDGVAAGLKNPSATLEACLRKAHSKYDLLSAMSTDNRTMPYRDSIKPMVAQALDELRPYGIPTEMQGEITIHPDGLRLPIVGHFDFRWSQHGILTDLKTVEKMPSQIRIPDARQVAFYAGSDNLDGRVTYVTPKKCQTYRVENLRQHREAMFQIARNVERFLSLSDDPKFFTSITAPDLASYYWNKTLMRRLAFEHWRI